MVDFNFLKDKKVFLTGHTGFKGSWLLVILKKFGAKVKGYSLSPSTTPNMYEAIGGDKLCESVIGDIADYDKLYEAMSSFQPEIVIHMAAQPIVLDSYARPLYTYKTNVMGTVNVLEAIRNLSSVRSFVNVTTDKVYENISVRRGYKEDDPLGGYDPYSNSKACSELVTKAYRSSFFNPDKYDKHGVSVSTCRAGNVLGGGDWAPDRLIPDCIRAALKNETIIIRNPSAVRPWQHVMEPLFQYLTVAILQYDHPEFSGHYNIGPEVFQCRPVGEIIEFFVKHFEGAKYKTLSNPDAPHEASLLFLDIEKSKKVLGFKPKYDAETTVVKAIEWYKAHSEGKNMLEFTERQIGDFLK